MFITKVCKCKWVLLLLMGITGCCAPNISTLDPGQGPERSLVMVKGDILLSEIIWDAGTTNARTISGAFLGASLFTVPPGTTQGVHMVQLRRGTKAGNTVPFTVTAPVPFTVPQVVRVSIVSAQFQQPGKVNAWLYVQGANVDAGAEVWVNGAVVPTAAHKGIQNNLFGVGPQHLSYPIYDYLGFLAAPGPQQVGAVLNIRVRNADGQLSNTFQYALPTSANTLDSDGDDIPDIWETNGYDADGNGTIDINFPALGADPHRPDIFVEVDVMTGLTNSPGAAVWTALRTAFDNAPIINPVGDDGVNLVIDASGSVPSSQQVSLTAADDPQNGLANFYTLKGANFDNAHRGRVYHYCIWGNAQPYGYSGISDVKMNANQTDFAGPGDDFLVSFDDFPAGYQTVRSMAATFMHELGHDLQQRHGGLIHARYNPTYNSVMSYSWQLRTGKTDAWRVLNPIYAPFCYQLNNAVEVNGAVPANVTSVLPDYSEGMGRVLVENNLDEPPGLYGIAIDWNNDGDMTDATAARDLTENGTTTETVYDFANWFGLVFSGPRQNGQYGN